VRDRQVPDRAVQPDPDEVAGVRGRGGDGDEETGHDGDETAQDEEAFEHDGNLGGGRRRWQRLREEPASTVAGRRRFVRKSADPVRDVATCR
jgi:hypothetical protein